MLPTLGPQKPWKMHVEIYAVLISFLAPTIFLPYTNNSIYLPCTTLLLMCLSLFFGVWFITPLIPPHVVVVLHPLGTLAALNVHRFLYIVLGPLLCVFHIIAIKIVIIGSFLPHQCLLQTISSLAYLPVVLVLDLGQSHGPLKPLLLLIFVGTRITEKIFSKIAPP